MRHLWFALVIALAVPVAHAQQAVASVDASAPVLDTTIVRAPGPGFWKISRAGHVMWVLGVVSPLPKDMAWNGARMRSIVASADAVLAEPSVVVDADIGFFAALSLAPSLVGIRALPDHKRLADVLPPATYARWTGLRQRYLGRDATVETWRPVFAAQKLNDRALDAHGLVSSRSVREAVAAATRARGLKSVTPEIRLVLKDPKAMVKDFKRADLADTRCFEQVLDRIERDVDTLSARADAWAAGDVATLRALQRPEPGDVCLRDVMGSGLGAKYGLDALKAQANDKWVAAADTMLAAHATTFAMLPMREVLARDGLVARLAAKGDRVEAPDAQTAAPVAATDVPH